jgi:2-hydroxy-3-keto-5-methylthiopentenyl-1-phosphate phosphatase
MIPSTIAIIADCDGTLAPDTTAQLLTQCGVEPRELFGRANSLVKKGWSQPLAYMHEMIQLTKPGRPLAELTETKIREIGENLTFYPGVPECFRDIKETIENQPEFRDARIRVESYVISGGIQDLLRSSLLAATTDRIWGCNFAYNHDGIIAFPKNVISHTDKTRYVYLINKGLTGPTYDDQPYAVNEPKESHERPVAFNDMIYLGDGPTDVPCMSLITHFKGYVIGIESEPNSANTYALSHGRRMNRNATADFTAGGSAYNAILNQARYLAENMRRQITGTGPVPQF